MQNTVMVKFASEQILFSNTTSLTLTPQELSLGVL